MSLLYTPITTTELVGNYGIFDPACNFLFDTVFSNEIRFPTAQVAIDVGQRSRRMAGLRDTMKDQGELSAFAEIATQFYAPAKIKVKHAIDPEAALMRRSGEAFNGELTPSQRRDIMVMQAQEIQTNEIGRREEYMAMEALTKGYVTVGGTIANPATISMHRPSSNYVDLSGTPQAWGQPGINPVAMLNSFSTQVQKSGGLKPQLVIMDPLAYQTFINSPGFESVMGNFHQANGYLDLNGNPIGGVGNEAAFEGKVGAHYIYQYQSYYTDNYGNVQNIMPDNTIIMVDPISAGGLRLYGAIQDNMSLQPIKRFPKTWYSYEDGMEYVETLSAPLVSLGWSKSCFCATVA